MDRHVTDLAGVLDSQTASQLESLLQELRQKTADQVAVVTLPDLEGRNIEEASADLFKKWGIGEKGKDNGVLFLIAVNDRRMRIEVGYGLEPVIPDGLAGRILDTAVIPSFRENQYSKGVVLGTVAIARILAENAGVTLNGKISQTGPRKQDPLSVLFSILLLAVLAILFVRHPWLLLLLLSRGGGGHGGGFGGFGGGGFGGFGGGSSGGGGSSRGW